MGLFASRARRLVVLGVVCAVIGGTLGVHVASASTASQRVYAADYVGGDLVYECGRVDSVALALPGHDQQGTATSVGLYGLFCAAGVVAEGLEARAALVKASGGICAGPYDTGMLIGHYSVSATLTASCGDVTYDWAVAWISDSAGHTYFSPDSNGGWPDITGPVGP
jgi:hypothetical protein